VQYLASQTISVTGTVSATADIEGVHVINKTSKAATTTNNKGSFIIQVALNDTLVFSAVQYKLHTVVINQDIIDSRVMTVFLIENVNELNEVLVGSVLTGDLDTDIRNSKAEVPINFYDVGIPGYQGKQLTQSERRLKEAGELKPSTILVGALTGSIPLNPILNALTGRTKMLKQRVKLEAQEELMYRVMAKFSKTIFIEDPLEEELHYEFFYFCSEDSLFTESCSDIDALETLVFLQEKLKVYKNNLKN